MKIIKNFNEIEKGSNYINYEGAEIAIKCFVDSAEIVFLSTGFTFIKFIEAGSGYLVASRLKRELENIKTLDEFTDYCFNSYKFVGEEKKRFNPFFKKLSGEIKVNKKITKTTIKKLLKHKDTTLRILQELTDDYIFDAENNFNRNKVLDNLEFLEDINHRDFKFLEVQAKTIKFFTCGFSTLIELSNPMMTIN